LILPNFFKKITQSDFICKSMTVLPKHIRVTVLKGGI
jgi:hypothetical protein